MVMRQRVGGVLALFSAATLFALVTLLVKFASRYHSGFAISSLRFAIGLILCSWFILRRYPGLRIEKPFMVFLRGLFGAGSMITSYAAISLTGPGRAALLGNTYPLFVALFGAIFFREKLKSRTFASIAVCTAGAFLVMRDGGGAKLSGDLLALANAVLAGLAVNCVRRSSAAGDSPFILYLSPCLFGLVMAFFIPGSGLSGPLALGSAIGTIGRVADAVDGTVLLLVVGIGSFAAQILMSVGYRSVPAGKGSVVFYWETALSVLLGVLFGGDSLSLRFGLGFLVILAGLWLNRERLPVTTRGHGRGGPSRPSGL